MMYIAHAGHDDELEHASQGPSSVGILVGIVFLVVAFVLLARYMNNRKK